MPLAFGVAGLNAVKPVASGALAWAKSFRKANAGGSLPNAGSIGTTALITISAPAEVDALRMKNGSEEEKLSGVLEDIS